MLKHGRAGVPLEVMGLMLGEFVDEFTVRVIGQFQSSTTAHNSTHTLHQMCSLCPRVVLVYQSKL